MDDWWKSLLSAMVGTLVGAYATRRLSDRSDRISRRFRAYSDWFLALSAYIAPSSDHLVQEQRRLSFLAARWALELVELDDIRRKEIGDITFEVTEHQGVPDLNERVQALMAQVRQSVAEDSPFES